MPAGDKQYLLVFTFPAATAPGASANASLPPEQTAGKQFAVPVGNTDKGQESFFVDAIFSTTTRTSCTSIGVRELEGDRRESGDPLA